MPDTNLIDNDTATEFISAGQEHLESIDVQLLAIETDPTDFEALDTVYRTFHMMMGSAGYLGLADIEHLARQAQSMLDRARRGLVCLEDAALDVTFDVVGSLKDQLACLRGALESGRALPDDPAPADMLFRISEIISRADGESSSIDELPVVTSDQSVGEILIESGVTNQETVVRVSRERFIVPTLSIVRMVRPGEEDLSTVFDHGEMLKIGDQLLPLHRLDKLYHINGAQQDPCQAAVLVVEHQDKKIALLVDELLGQQQTVIKNLGEALQGTPGIAGGAIMPDGDVGLILDIAGVTKLAASTITKPNRNAA